jgi:hypothetical protein
MLDSLDSSIELSEQLQIMLLSSRDLLYIKPKIYRSTLIRIRKKKNILVKLKKSIL